MESLRRLCNDIKKDGTVWLIIVMLFVKFIPSSWLHFRGLCHYYNFDPYAKKGYIALAVQVYLWLPILEWQHLAIRQNPGWQHVSLVNVYNTDQRKLHQIVEMLNQAMWNCYSCDGIEFLEFLNWQPWPIYSTNALLWPSHHSSVIGLLSENIRWYSNYNYHVVV